VDGNNKKYSRWRRQQRGAQDPVRKGLLYAGTEGSVYVSINDGDDWQPLQLNLPHTRCAISRFMATISLSPRTPLVLDSG